MHLASSSDGKPRGQHRDPGRGFLRPLSSLGAGTSGEIADVLPDSNGRTDRLLALGVTPGASVTLLQRFPGIVFLCDQTELAVERDVAEAILIHPQEEHS